MIAQEVLLRHARGVPGPRARDRHTLPVGGQYQWRADGEYHLFNPETIHRLQKAVRTGNYETFKEYSRAGQRPGDATCAPCAACSTSSPADAGAARRSRTGRERS